MNELARLAGTLALLAFALPGRGAASTGPASAAAQDLSPSAAAKLVKDLVGDDEKRALAARAKLVATRAEDRPALFDALERAQPKRQEKTRDKIATSSISTPEAEVAEAPYIVRWPSKGKPPFPLLFRLHGSGDTAEDFDSLNVSQAFQGFVIVTPQIPSHERDSWSEDGALQMLDRLYRKALREYAVDPDRVYFSGFSAGGAEAFRLAQIWPQRTAGFHSVGRLRFAWADDPDESMRPLQWVPGEFLVGSLDTEERLAGFRTAQAFYEAHDYPGRFQFVDGRGHEALPEFDQAVIERLRAHERVRYPKSIHAIYHWYKDDEEMVPLRRRVYWLEASEHSWHAPAEARIEGQTIQVVAPEVSKGFVLLNDRLVDLDQPVTLVVNGTEVFAGPVERSTEHLLDSWEADHDPGALYWNRLTFGD